MKNKFNLGDMVEYLGRIGSIIAIHDPTHVYYSVRFYDPPFDEIKPSVFRECFEEDLTKVNDEAAQKELIRAYKGCLNIEFDGCGLDWKVKELHIEREVKGNEK